MTARRCPQCDTLSPSALSTQSSALRRAFTLLELLVALAMMAVLSLSLLACMRIAFRARDDARVAVEPSRTAALAMEILQADLEAAVPPRGVLAGTFIGAPQTAEQGANSATLTFYATASGPAHLSGDGEIKRVELAVVPATDGSEGQVLVRRVTGNLLALVPPPPDEEVICRGVVGFHLRYFDGYLWQDVWDSSQYDQTLPPAVEVSLELERPGPASAAGPAGTLQTLRFTRVVALPCGTMPADEASSLGAGGGQ